MNRVALITGSAKRIGATIASYLHARGFNVIIHFSRSLTEASALCKSLNQKRPNSASTLQADLIEFESYETLINRAVSTWGRLDVLINNASLFLHTPLAQASITDWDRQLAINTKACFFLSQHAAAHLKAATGCIINISDARSNFPKPGFPIYALSKAALDSLTLSLAQELAPTVRVNAIAPGPILTPNTNHPISHSGRHHCLVDHTPTGEEIAMTAQFIIDNPFLTGEIIRVNGGKHLT